ncbi:alpha/beta hydrolase [Nakamurella sp. GG22]
MSATTREPIPQSQDAPQAIPRRPTRIVRHAPGFGGTIGAVLFFCLTQSPSMLPRTWLLQGVVSGLTAAFGYGIGASIGAAARALGPESWSRRPSRQAWWTLIGLSAVLIIVFLLLGRGWQNEVRALMGMTDPLVWDVTLIFVVGALVAAVLVLLARVIRLGSRRLGRALDRFIPRRLAYVSGAVVVALIVAGLVQGVLWDGFISAMNRVSSLGNGGTAPGIEQPTDPARSGSPQSLAAWSTLGVEGRTFVASGPDQATLTAFNGTPAKDPIRVYAGLDSADSLQGEVDLVLAELDRTGAWDRSVLTVVTTTGTGWVDPAAADSMEYVWNGDTAQVALQYSYLPSWVSFLVDRSKASAAAAALIDAVRERWLQLPADSRPKLFVFGESLGAFGTDTVFDSVQQVVSETDGALLAGPPFADELHQRITAQREPTSPVWLPIVDQGRQVRFAVQPADLANPPSEWSTPRMLYIQNSSDPVVWWGPDLMLHRPEWLENPRGPDVSPSMHWIPVVTFWQVVVDLAFAQDVPFGHGHRYGRDYVDGWVALGAPADWTRADTEALRSIRADAG